MNILFFDTETTGFYNFKLPPTHEAQPRIVQLAAHLCDDAQRTIASFSFILGGENDVIEIPDRVVAIHGITTAHAVQFGMGASAVLSSFFHLYERADLIVAHNISFDKPVIESEAARCYGHEKPLSKPAFCTMKEATAIVNLPPTERMLAAGLNKPKVPKLEECYRHFFGEEMQGAHDAMVDVLACTRVFFHLRELTKEEQAAA